MTAPSYDKEHHVIQEFKEFINRGNMVELAVAFVLGAAFTIVVTSIVDGLVTPVIAAIFGEPNLASVGNFTINGSQFSVGLVLDALFRFAATALALFFIVKAYNSMRKPAEEPAGPTETELLAEIRDALVARSTPPTV
jgi:large conductance mechanosensitive channel